MCRPLRLWHHQRRPGQDDRFFLAKVESEENRVQACFETGLIVKPQDKYLMFVRWSNEDQLYIGYYPDLFPAGGVCHGATPVEAYSKLCEIVDNGHGRRAAGHFPPGARHPADARSGDS